MLAFGKKRIDKKVVELLNNAISEKDETMPFYTSINAGVLGSKYLHTLKRDLRPWLKDSMIEKTEVKGITLSSIIEKYKIKVVNIIKLDIEDMEYEVLKSSEQYLENIQSIVMQWHAVRTRDKVISLLKKHGFAITYYEPRDYGDIYFANSRFKRL